MPGMNSREAHRILSGVADSHLPGVYHSRSWGIRLDESHLDALEVIAKESQNGKARLCMHPSPEDHEQQMLVTLSKDCVDQIHLHPEKGETVLWVRGSAEHRTFDKSGAIAQRTPLGPTGFQYLHTPAGVPHHVIVLSEVFIFWEFAKGPFHQDSTVPVYPFNERLGVK